MDVKEAVRAAKEYVNEVFAGENVVHVSLEEVLFDESENAWKVTIGFFRAWDDSRDARDRLSRPFGLPEWKSRAYKVVKMDDETGKVVSLTHRRFPEVPM